MGYRGRQPRQHGLLISDQRSAELTPMSCSSPSDIRASSPRSRARRRHDCNSLRHWASRGGDISNAKCGNAMRMIASWATLWASDRVDDCRPSNDISASIACAIGMRSQASGERPFSFPSFAGEGGAERRMGMARRRGARVDPALLSTPHPAHSPSRDGRLSTPDVATFPAPRRRGNSPTSPFPRTYAPV
jgi:hypothetical protein